MNGLSQGFPRAPMSGLMAAFPTETYKIYRLRTQNSYFAWLAGEFDALDAQMRHCRSMSCVTGRKLRADLAARQEQLRCEARRMLSGLRPS
ncbi:hypothetical protein FGG78_31405 [Thioclava sp. BHET1]|nr:hypothetical protein FGG78_31405 [Thioclava sp. BHET1]